VAAGRGPEYARAVITRLEIENFKAIHTLSFALGPMTVLVGPNDAGKTTILQALDLVGKMARTDIDRAFDGHGKDYFADGDLARPIRIVVEGTTGSPHESGTYRHSLSVGYANARLQVLQEELAWNGELVYAQSPGADKAFQYWTGEFTLLRSMYTSSGGLYAAVLADLSAQYVAFNPQALAQPCAPNAAFGPDGSGLAALLQTMLNAPDRRPVEALDAGLRRLSKHVNNVAVDTLRTPGKVEALLALAPSRHGIAARETSMGLLLATGYLALMHGTSSQRFLVEEPENGVHPRALQLIVDVLRELARSGRQVVMTTHSPVLLNYIEPEDIRIVTRTAEQGVIVTAALDSASFKENTQRLDPGELWYAVGDEGIVASAS